MRCDKCGFESPAGLTFCGKCGVKLLAAKPARAAEARGSKCPSCGSAMPTGAKFCGICGKSLRGEPVQSPQKAGLGETPPEGPAAEENEAADGGKAAGEEKAAAPAAQQSDPSRAKKAVPREEKSAAAAGGEPEPVHKEPEPVQKEPEPVSGTSRPVKEPLPRRVEVLRPVKEPEAQCVSPANSLRPMVLIPAGWFAMGSVFGIGNPDECPRHQVELSAFYIDGSAVSNCEYERFDPRHRRLRPEAAEGDHDPVVFVTYQDCLSYCRWRERQEGVPAGVYSLPSEAQWERAARGGLPDQSYPWGNEIVPEACNTREAERGRTVPVDEGIPNRFGLFHIGSNVREWCLDFYSETYYKSREASGPDPAGPPSSVVANMNVVRGASFQDPATELGRCAARNYAPPRTSSDDIGFRCVRKYP